ncbi:hypothetical protein HPB51_014665 [Rhipicephalus microplus]|uniref:Uncharacterized protein n=1 Tax=Rhipicephalus microplus TaxID=6941 RepID=A0A9J6F5I9_RHIMP|nr:hypothetical protein HPB51_014665 [Rhipicephalus microplus]
MEQYLVQDLLEICGAMGISAGSAKTKEAILEVMRAENVTAEEADEFWELVCEQRQKAEQSREELEAQRHEKWCPWRPAYFPLPQKPMAEPPRGRIGASWTFLWSGLALGDATPRRRPRVPIDMGYVRSAECCPSVTEAIQPLGGVSITGPHPGAVPRAQRHATLLSDVVPRASQGPPLPLRAHQIRSPVTLRPDVQLHVRAGARVPVRRALEARLHPLPQRMFLPGPPAQVPTQPACEQTLIHPTLIPPEDDWTRPAGVGLSGQEALPLNCCCCDD